MKFRKYRAGRRNYLPIALAPNRFLSPPSYSSAFVSFLMSLRFQCQGLAGTIPSQYSANVFLNEFSKFPIYRHNNSISARCCRQSYSRAFARSFRACALRTILAPSNPSASSLSLSLSLSDSRNRCVISTARSAHLIGLIESSLGGIARKQSENLSTLARSDVVRARAGNPKRPLCPRVPRLSWTLCARALASVRTR